MILNNRILRQLCLSAGILLLVLNGFITSAKTGGGSNSNSPGSEQIFNLSDFNAVGDGVVDDGPALQRALDALANAGGGTLFIPAGRYFVATPVTKDFSALSAGKVKIQGVPSLTMPAPRTADGQDLAAGLDLTSEIIPATGELHDAISITNLRDLLIEHVAFVGQPSAFTDAYITLYLSDIDKITIRHSEFYGISTFGLRAGFGGGNVIRAVRSDMSIESTVFLGCTANSGAYAPIVENLEWHRFSITDSIFLDYGLRPFFGKTGLGAPLSWINIGNAAIATPESPRREVVISDIFLDEGGWVGISAFPHRFGPPVPIDLIYISGLKMNVSNLGTAGHIFYDARNLLIENSHYGWSRNTIAAVDINRFEHAILDRLTCIDDADRIRADDRTERLTVINSAFGGLDSLARTTTVMDTPPEQDPVQYVRQQFASILGRQPDPAAHFYWSDMLIKCGSDNDCLNQERSALSEYLYNQPQQDFSLSGTVTDENGNPLSGAAISLTGSQLAKTVTDAQGSFRFSGLPTSGRYTVAVEKRHYSFVTNSVLHPATDVAIAFSGRLNRHSIGGRIAKVDRTGVSGVTVQLLEAPGITATTDADGFYLFPELAAGENYTVVPSMNDFVFSPVTFTVDDLGEDRTGNFATERTSFSLSGSVTDENGDPVSGAAINLTGSQTSSSVTDSEGNFLFSGLPVSGGYIVAVEKRHYSFVTSSHTFERPNNNVTFAFRGRLKRHSIGGRITKADGSGLSGVTVQLAQSPAITATTDANGVYSFTELAAGENYTVVPSPGDFVFDPLTTTFNDLSADQPANFVGKLQPQLLMIENSELAVALDAVSFMAQPFSLFSSLGFSTDGFMRVMIFAKNLEPVNASQVSVVAEDDAGQMYPIEIEFIGEVPGQSWLKQLNLKISPTTLSGKCVQLQLSVADVKSNNGRVCIR